MTWLIDEPGLIPFWSENQWDFPQWYNLQKGKCLVTLDVMLCFWFLRTKARSRQNFIFAWWQGNAAKRLTLLEDELEKTKRKKIFYQTPVCLPCPLFKYLINFDISSTSEVFCVIFSFPHDTRHSTYHLNQFEERMQGS